jgi:hypothetical protein
LLDPAPTDSGSENSEIAIDESSFAKADGSPVRRCPDKSANPRPHRTAPTEIAAARRECKEIVQQTHSEQQQQAGAEAASYQASGIIGR